jgi:hypothetical protein
MEPQGALFDPDELADHHVGRGEFAGMEFIHTHARTIINELPKASSMPFRHTINVYRGCSHACSYCLAGDTRILMGDGRTRALAEVVKGDVVYGTIRQGAYRRYVRTVVADHWQTLKPAYRLTLHDGTTIVASGDHRFLTRRGWKHVTGTEQGFSRRPHLTPNDHLLGMGHIVNAMQETDDYRKGYLCGMIRGDGNLKRYQYEQERRTRVVYRFRLALADDEALERSQRYLSSFGILTTPFAFTPETSTRRRMGAIRTSTEAHFRAISQLVQWPTPPTGEWWRGFLAGVFDAEGSYSSGVLRISNKDATMLQQIKTGLVTLGFDAIIDSRGPDLASAVRLRQGQHEHTRFFHLVNPAISRKLSIAGRAVTRLSHLRCDVLPGQADDADFLWRDRPRVCLPILGGDDHATELGEHVEDRGLGLRAIPRGERAGRFDVFGVMACGGIPADRESVHDESERDRALHGLFQPVASLAYAAELLRIFDRDLDRPA